MKHSEFRTPLAWFGLVLISAVCLRGCYAESSGGPAQVTPDASVNPEDSGADTATIKACSPLQSGEPLPARSIAMSAEQGPRSETIYVSDLFSRFKNACGGCHVDGARGGYTVTANTFVNRDVVQRALDAIETQERAKVMPQENPPNDPLLSERSPDDAVRQLASLLKVWLDEAGPAPNPLPRNLFVRPVASSGSQFKLSASAGMALTNIGDCIPDRQLIGIEQSKSEQLDAKFERATRLSTSSGAERLGLPERLSETDLFTFDTEILAQHGVIPFAPAYPLWSDDARKIRHVRVPRGQSIRYNRESGQFEIPTNTRFYKTFAKKVIEKDGSERYRKIETRIIVSRPDGVDIPDPTFRPPALFGAYRWNDDETEAVLVTETYRNREPFADDLFTYDTDEGKAEEIRAQHAGAFDLEDRLEKAKAIRRYAIPGSERCIQCHIGSPSKSFVLGFLPLQIARRPTGEGGVIEPTGADELTQLQRLIDFGVITGLSSASDLDRSHAQLEHSQGDRKPRNDYELIAQGYLLGNCAHCHNERGFTTISNPELDKLLDFLPGPELHQGIFQFPLERTSPRIFRGPSSNIPIPYITPSIVDLQSGERAGRVVQVHPTRRDIFYYGPWRSLIFRNVSTPAGYAEDNALFPHMPMNAPGFDCRLHKIVSEWMVSIPAVRKSPEIPEYQAQEPDEFLRGAASGTLVDMNPQPYVEVEPGQEGYEQALDGVDSRLTLYRLSPSSMYNYCPDTSDIVDPWILRGSTKAGVSLEELSEPRFCNFELIPTLNRGDRSANLPCRAHWAKTDITDARPWAPRRGDDWRAFLVDEEYPPQPSAQDNERLQAWLRAVDAAKSVRSASISDELRQFALRKFPLGVWQQKPACNLSMFPTVASYTGADRLRWMDLSKTGTESVTPPPPDAHVYPVLPGEAVFRAICSNCHGPAADSKGRIADTLANISGGNTRVANLRDGFFGPPGNPAATRNWESTFGSEESAARYVLWMASGGTERTIPPSINAVVGTTSVLGVERSFSSLGVVGASGNMLTVAQGLCRAVMDQDWEFFFQYRKVGVAPKLIYPNGDAELWRRLCSVNNPLGVRMAYVVDGEEIRILPEVFVREDFVSRYPDQPVMNGRSLAPSLLPDNPLPWCIQTVPDDDIKRRELLHEFLVEQLKSEDVAYCPPDIATVPTLSDDALQSDKKAWAQRGAMNAGMSVFLYLNEVAKGRQTPEVPYNACDSRYAISQ